jgi:hypothetical protein
MYRVIGLQHLVTLLLQGFEERKENYFFIVAEENR